jgi:hypothetical protein
LQSVASAIGTPAARSAATAAAGFAQRVEGAGQSTRTCPLRASRRCPRFGVLEVIGGQRVEARASAAPPGSDS